MLAVRSRIQRSDLLELQREAATVASQIGASGPVDLGAVGTHIDAQHELALYDDTGTLISGSGPPEADDVVEAGLAGTFAEGEVDGDLVAAVPVRMTLSGPRLVVRIAEPGTESDRRVREGALLLAAAAVTVLLLAAVVGALLARRLSRPIERLRLWASTIGRDQ